jgi:pyruvate formate lyase activating enzyme
MTFESMRLQTARWWQVTSANQVRCLLCPRRCVIDSGKFGFCAVRENRDGTLVSYTYGRPVSVNIDPIEKKPLANFMPGTKTFSFGTFGCNLNCVFCQNDSLSRGHYRPQDLVNYVPPDVVVQNALLYKADSISFTYNEPTVFAEYAVDVAKLAKSAGLPLVLVSNGYIEHLPASELYPLIDAANIDMKGFSESFYSRMTSSHLANILESIKYLYALGKHIEITTLIIPDENDSMEMIEEWLNWVENNLDKSVPLHFSAYHPAYKCAIPATSSSTILELKKYADSRGFCAYTGNI